MAAPIDGATSPLEEAGAPPPPKMSFMIFLCSVATSLLRFSFSVSLVDFFGLAGILIRQLSNTALRSSTVIRADGYQSMAATVTKATVTKATRQSKAEHWKRASNEKTRTLHRRVTKATFRIDVPTSDAECASNNKTRTLHHQVTKATLRIDAPTSDAESIIQQQSNKCIFFHAAGTRL